MPHALDGTSTKPHHVIEPAALTEREAAQFLSISPRLLRELPITPIRIPGRRRVLYDVADLRALLASWKAADGKRA